MENNPAKAGAKNKVMKIIGYILLLLVIGVIAALQIWKFSGSNTWELEIEKNGVKIYTIKTPGQDLKKVKGTVTVKATLNQIVDFLQDQDVCDDFSCLQAEIIERINSQFYYNSFRYPAPLFFKDREFVTQSHFVQDPKTLELFYYHTAAPGVIPPDDCCVRLSRFYVLWRFKPVGDGKVEIQFMRDFDFGGFVPNFLLNPNMGASAYSLLNRLQGLLDRERYKDARYDFVVEPGTKSNVKQIAVNATTD
ncbi:hypothetical protein [Aliikangiella maris]|uniref:Uncharacterized protein n=2 Tax=Aliikangiella maris TaxID=3162458 RepID=A0ABV3MTF3_9GAMM